MPPVKDLHPGRARVLSHLPQANDIESSLASSRRGNHWIPLLYTLILVGLCSYIYTNVQMLTSLWGTAEENRFLRAIFLPCALWAVAGTFLTFYRTVLWMRYRPTAPADFDDAPSLTVVIPAYNEGAMVMNSIDSVASARYPAEKLEIIVVDDGSKDDTWSYMELAAARYPGTVTTVRFPQNRGKRDALAVGFERARGEFVVTIDSDSVIEPDALLALMGPFRDSKVGAVAGKVVVYNTGEGLIASMLHVRFLLTFDVSRAVESSYGTVYCCPGALAAYRVEAVRKVLPEWMNQTFLGSRCAIGEDRALTNDLLNEGFDTVYQSNAVVRTIVPVKYQKLCKMFLRWNRSYVREEVRFMRIVWRRPPYAQWIALLDRLVTNLHYPISYVALVLLTAAVVMRPMIAVQFLLVMGFFSLLSTTYCLRSDRSPRGLIYGVLFSFYSFFAMSWIMPYAFFTVRTGSWMTREVGGAVQRRATRRPARERMAGAER